MAIQFVPLLNHGQALTVSQLSESSGNATLNLQNRISNTEPTQNFILVPCSTAGFFIEYSCDSRSVVEV